MTDDWSLKGKIVLTVNLPEDEDAISGVYYKHDDIETLREKVIELVKTSMNTDENPEWTLKQINKLFGVEK